MPGTDAKKRASQYSQRSLSIVEADTRQVTFIAFAAKVVSEKFNVLPFLSTSYQAVQYWTGIMILLTAAESILLASILVFFARGPDVRARRRPTDERIYNRLMGAFGSTVMWMVCGHQISTNTVNRTGPTLLRLEFRRRSCQAKKIATTGRGM